MPSLPEIVQRMTRLGWKPGIPASEDQVRVIETRAGIALPSGYRDFLLFCGGGDPGSHEAWRGLWRAQDLLAWNNRYRDVYPGLFAIGNEAFMVYALDFRNPDRPPIVSLGFSSTSWDDVLTDSESFLDWLDDHVPKK